MDDEGLLRAIVRDPDDDTPRLIYADWLQENDNPESAEFIRTQIQLARGCGKCRPDRTIATRGPYDPKGADFDDNGYYDPCPECGEGCDLEKRESELLDWNGDLWLRDAGLQHPVLTAGGDLATGYFSRGFIYKIVLPLRAFCGGKCARCDGGEVAVNMRTPPRKCNICLGVGEFPALADTIFRLHPITEVELNDRTPFNAGWYNADRRDPDPFVQTRSGIPQPLYDEIEDYLPESHAKRWKAFGSNASAQAALLRACVNYGRTRAGFDPYYRRPA